MSVLSLEWLVEELGRSVESELKLYMFAGGSCLETGRSSAIMDGRTVLVDEVGA